jgi:hypothetical protein
MVQQWKAPLSLYTNREKAVQALEKMDYRILGERRPQAFY